MTTLFSTVASGFGAGAVVGVGVVPTPRASAAVAGVAAAGVAEGDGAAGAGGKAGADCSWARVADSPAQKKIAAVAAQIRERWSMEEEDNAKTGRVPYNFGGRRPYNARTNSASHASVPISANA